MSITAAKRKIRRSYLSISLPHKAFPDATTTKRKLHRSYFYSYQARRAGTRAFPARMKRFKSESRLYAIIRDNGIRDSRRANRGARLGAFHLAHTPKPAHTPKVKRKPGLLQGRIWIAPDFDDAMELVATGAREEAHFAEMGV